MTPEEALAAIEKALQIGSSCYEGDSWFATNDKIVADTEEGDQAMAAGFEGLRVLRQAVPPVSET